MGTKTWPDPLEDDKHLREVVRREQEQKWREENADFIAAYNVTIESEGLPLAEWRSF